LHDRLDAKNPADGRKFFSIRRHFLAARSVRHSLDCKPKDLAPAAEAEMIENANWTNTASIEPFHHRTSERVFDYSWAMDLIDRSMLRLPEEWSISGRSHRFEVLEKYLSGSREIRGR
jgi:hypothetical protein